MIDVIIPTYNRPNSIETLMRDSILKYKGNLFAFYIVDSSDSYDTEDVFNKYHDLLNLNNVTYKKFSSSISADNKVLEVIRDTHNEYFYVLGDSVLIDFNLLEQILTKNDYDSYCVINLDDANRIGYLGQDKLCKPNVIYSYRDVAVYATKYFSHLTFWGAILVKREVFVEGLSHKIEKKYFNNTISFWLPCCIIESLNLISETGQIPKLGTVYLNCVSYLPKIRSWTKSYYEVTFKVFNQNIQYLDFLSTDIQKKIIKFFRDDYLVSKSYVINLRINKVINIKDTLKYKNDISYISGYFRFILLVSLIPIWILKFARSLKKFFHYKVKS